METRDGVLSKLENRSATEVFELLQDEYRGKLNVPGVVKDVGMIKFAFKCFLFFLR